MMMTAASGEDVRYTDDINGFSLIPPVGAIQTKVDEAATLAQWIKVDPKTSNTEWALSITRQVADVLKADGSKMKDSDYAALKLSGLTESILAEVKAQPGIKILSQQETTISSRTALVIECSGLAATNLQKEMLDAPENRRWMKQAWIRITPRMFLMFKIVAREKFKKTAQTAWDFVIDSLKITDDKAGSVRQQEKVINAEKLLDSFAKNQLQGIFKKGVQLFVISKDGKNIGWLCMGAQPKIFLEKKGYELRSYAMLKDADAPARLIYQQMFVSEDLSSEQWRLWSQSGDGPDATLMAEDGMVQDNRILCESNASGSPQNKQAFELPVIASNMYLPKAIGTVIASQLVNSQASGYIFAEYDSSRNNLAMRELTVAGPEELATAAGPVKVVKVIETSDRSNHPTYYWVSTDGQIMKIQNPAGMVLTASSREIVAKIFPKVSDMIKAIRSASQKKWKEGNR